MGTPAGQSVSRATVYRTLPLLTESGLVREMDSGRTQVLRPELRGASATTISSAGLGKIVEFESQKIEQLENEISRRLGFSVRATACNHGDVRGIQETGACSKKIA